MPPSTASSACGTVMLRKMLAQPWHCDGEDIVSVSLQTAVFLHIFMKVHFPRNVLIIHAFVLSAKKYPKSRYPLHNSVEALKTFKIKNTLLWNNGVGKRILPPSLPTVSTHSGGKIPCPQYILLAILVRKNTAIHSISVFVWMLYQHISIYIKVLESTH